MKETTLSRLKTSEFMELSSVKMVKFSFYRKNSHAFNYSKSSPQVKMCHLEDIKSHLQLVHLPMSWFLPTFHCSFQNKKCRLILLAMYSKSQKIYEITKSFLNTLILIPLPSLQFYCILICCFILLLFCFSKFFSFCKINGINVLVTF